MPPVPYSVIQELYEALDKLTDITVCAHDDLFLRPQIWDGWLADLQVATRRAIAILVKVREEIKQTSAAERQPQKPHEYDYAPPIDRSVLRHPFVAVEGNQYYCGECGAGKLHPIHHRGPDAR